MPDIALLTLSVVYPRIGKSASVESIRRSTSGSCIAEERAT